MDLFKRSQHTCLGKGGVKCSCCNRMARKGRRRDKRLNRMARRKLKQLLLFLVIPYLSFSQISLEVSGFKGYNVQQIEDASGWLYGISYYWTNDGPGHNWYVEGTLSKVEIKHTSDITGITRAYTDTRLGFSVGGIEPVNTESFIWTMDFFWMSRARQPWVGINLQLDTPLQVGNIGIKVGVGTTLFALNKSGNIFGKIGLTYRI